MNDRELLELSAKAAGLKEHGWMGGTYCHVVNNTLATFEPLTDDGDALRLSVKLGIDICHNHVADHQKWVLAERAGCESAFPPACCVEDDFEESQRMVATRKAIVRAAAEIGKNMP